MSRRRSRRRGRRTGWTKGLVVLLVMGFVASMGGAHSAAFSTATTDRAASANVTTDESGAHTLDIAGSVHINATDPMVNVTNRLGDSVTITVTLTENSTAKGDLVVDGVNESDQASFSLSTGDTKRVELDVPDDSSLVGETVYFHVNASGGGIDVSAPDRSVPIDG